MENIEKGWNLDNSYTRLPELYYTKVNLNPISSPKLAILNDQLAISLGLDKDELISEEGINILAGNKSPKNSIPLAQAYGGHQFGYFTMLGDGRAILLGEQITPNGERFDIQLKGSGRTPYSRGGDGRAALGPMLREYIISEAMYGLGIPTTRSLSVVTTGNTIFRETPLQGAVLTRVASSHIRVGTFQYGANWGTKDNLKELADYTIKRHFPDVEFHDNPYLSLLKEVIKAQASLISKWQLVGFIHGVMNTDNMAISGETIDYGPCAFMDTYDPATVFSSIDIYGRYAYGNQPSIAAWNLARYAESLLALINEEKNKSLKLAQDALKEFSNLHYNNWLMGMRKKLGIFNEELEDEVLIEELLNLMKISKADYTNTFLGLTFEQSYDLDLFNNAEFMTWYNKWKNRLKRQENSIDESKLLMKNHNPSIIPRNHQVEKALESAVKGDYCLFNRLHDILSNPYAHIKDQEEFIKPPEPSSKPYRTFCGT